MDRALHTYENNTGFIRIDGDDIQDGRIDIKSAAAILDGTQSVMEYFLKKEDSDLAQLEVVNFPIQTRAGSWEVVVPFVEQLMSPGGLVGMAGAAFVGRPLSAGITEFAKTIGKEKALASMGAKSGKESFENAFDKLLAVIEIAQHLGVVDRKQPLNTKLSQDGKTVLLINQHGNVMTTTPEKIKVFSECPDKLLRKLGTVVTDYRSVSIGYYKDNRLHEKVIDRDSKEVFVPDDDAQTPILPELLEGQRVRLVGYVSRGNQATNTLGFRYNDHVITCEPHKKLITGYIDAHYKTCEMEGYVVRTSKAEILHGKRDRPKIVFDKLSVIKSASSQTEIV